MSKPIASLIGQLKEAYAAAGLDCADGLLPPADEAAPSVMASRVGVPVPAELLDIFRLHGGQRMIGAGVTGLFGEHRLHTPAEVADHHEISTEECTLDEPTPFPPAEDEVGYWDPRLLPFASWDAYDLCLDPATGEVWEFIANTGLVRHWPSLRALLERLLEGVQADGGIGLGGTRDVG